MSVKVENLENNMAKLTVEVPAEKFDAAIKKAYNKNKNQFNIPGFRKGKVPMNVIEKMYGADIFYEEAANIVLPETYSAAVDESGLDVVSRPTIDFVQIGKGQDFIYTAEVAVKPEVKLGKYMGVVVEREEIVVTDEEVAAELEKEQKTNARKITVEDRPVAEGDTAVIDFTGSIDGVEFEGGKGENHPLVIGSGSFIPGFEEQLIGANAGDEVEVKVTFPEDYQSADLAGKDAVFACKVNEIKVDELPELDDDFAAEVSEFDTLDEYKESIKENLKATKESDQKNQLEQAAIDQIVEEAEIDIPQAMLDTEVDGMIDQMAQSMQQQGISLQQYMQITGTSIDDLREQVRPDALKRIQSTLVLEAIVEAEGIEISDETVDAELEKMSKAYNMDVETIKQYMGDLSGMKNDLAIQEAVRLIMGGVKYQDKAAE